MQYWWYCVSALFITHTWCDVYDNGGWFTDPSTVVSEDGPCNIDVFDVDDLSREDFLKRFAYSEPVVIRGIDNSKFAQASTRERLLNNYGHINVLLASGNTYSYKKLPCTFAEYITGHLRPQDKANRGNETYFLFGDIDRSEWRPLLDLYDRPTKYIASEFVSELSFGVAGAGTGVPFHVHGPGFAEVIYGAKRWFLYAPDDKPAFDPDATTLHWYTHNYTTLSRDKKPLECLMKPGELIYFPHMWWHATLNTRTAVFVSTFLSPK